MSSLKSNRQSSPQEIWVPGEGVFEKGENPLANRLQQIHVLQDALTSSPSSHDMLELALATATSLDISLAHETPLVWMINAGEPGSDKTQTVLSLREAPNSYFLDTLTGNSFISGYVNERTGKPAEDLLPKLDGKCLIIKDLTTLFSLRDDKVKEVLGALQSIYDGSYAKATGVRSASYESRFSILGCVTPLTLRKHHRYMSMIGSRFLIYRVVSLTEAQIAKGFEIVWDADDHKEKIKEFQRLVVEHVMDLLTLPFTEVEATTKQQERINQLAQLLAQGRTVIFKQRVPGDYPSEYVMVDKQTEQPWRAVHQLRTLCSSLARIHGRNLITEHELELARRVVLSTIPVDRAEILAQFPFHPEGFSLEEWANSYNKNFSWENQVMQELLTAGIVVSSSEPNGRVYQSSPEFKDLLVKPLGQLDHVQDLAK